MRVRGRQVEEVHGKDIRISEELKSQRQKQSQYQKSMNQTLTFKHDTEFHDFRTAAAAQACEGGDPELTTTIRKSVIINEYDSDKASPNDTILTTTPLESSRKGRM